MIEGLKPQAVLGLPWIRMYQPHIEWGSGHLCFPSGQKWPIVGNEGAEEQCSKELALATLGDDNCLPGEDEDGGLPPVSPRQAAPGWMKPLLEEYKELFAPLEGIPPVGRIQYAITLLSSANPVMKRPYRLSESQRKDVKAQIEDALDWGWVKPSSSA